MSNVERNQELGLSINRDIWNERRYEMIPEYFHEDFVADYSPYAVRKGRDQIEGMVERAHAAFEGFREDVKLVVADERHVVLHFTIRGRHTGEWGGIGPTAREIEHDEIVIMTIEDGRVRRQTGVVDNLTALRQIGVIPAREG